MRRPLPDILAIGEADQNQETTAMAKKSNPPAGEIVQIDGAQIQNRLDQVVRDTVEEALMEIYLAGLSVRRDAQGDPCGRG